MFWTRLIVGLSEFGLSVLLAVFIVYWSYKSFVKVTVAYDAEAEIYKGNVAVAILMASLMLGAALIMQQSIYPVVGIVTVAMTSGGGGVSGALTLAGCALGHLFFGFLLSVGCVELAVRFFELLNKEMDEEIRKGNVAVAVIMAGVIVVISMFMQQGVGALNKALIPQPKLGTLAPPV